MISQSPALPGRVVLVEGRYLADTGPSTDGWHKLSTAALCLQKYAGAEILRLQGPPQDYLTRGTLLHAGIAANYLHQWAIENGQDPYPFWEPMQAVEVQARSMEPVLEARGANHTAASLVHAVQMALHGYLYRYAEQDRARYKVLGVELEFVANIPKDPNDPSQGAWQLTRGVDLVLLDRMIGKTVMFDHKGRGGVSFRTESAYENDLTCTALWKFGTTQWGPDFGGVVLNYISVPKVGARDAAIRLDRVEAKRSPWQEANIPQTVRHYRELIERCMTLDPWHWPKAQVGGGACIDFFGSPCFMLDYCKYGPPTRGDR